MHLELLFVYTFLCHNFKRTVKCQTMFPTLHLEKIINICSDYVRYLLMQMVN